MKKNLTELVMILDRSGSMGGLESDTIGGYNSMLQKQSKEEGDVLVSTVLFDDYSKVVHDRVPIGEIKPLTDKEYYVRGCTALLDAIGGAYAREEDRREKTIFVITTDGMENASEHYTFDQVRHMVNRQQERYGWEFIFLGANMDAVSVAGNIGIRRNRAVEYLNDGKGIALNYEVISEAVTSMRTSAAPIDGSWKKKIEKDRKARRRK